MARREEGFIFRYCWAEELLKLPEDLRGRINDAIQRFALYGEEPADEYLKYTMYAVIRNQILRDREKYQEVCEKRREAINTRWEREHEAQANTNDTNVFNSIQVNTNDTNNTNKGNVSKGNKGNVNKTSNNTQRDKSRFTPPSIEEVRVYVCEEGLNIDPEEFMDYGTANGWKLSNGNPMKDWRATLRQWHRRKNQQKENQQRKDYGQKHPNIADTLHPQMCDYGESTI